MRAESTLAVLFLLILLPPASASLHRRDYVSYYAGTPTVLEGRIVDNWGGLPLPLSLEVHSDPLFLSSASDSLGNFRFELGGLEGEHEFWLRMPLPGYRPSSSLLRRAEGENLEIYREGENLVVHGSLSSGRTRDLGVLELLFDPLSLSLSPGSASSPPSSYTTVGVPYTAQRTVQARDASGNPVYEEVRVPTGYRWEEYTQTGSRTETLSLSTSEGEWTPTGRTHTIYGVGPLSTDLPSLPPGYRWVKVSGNWYSATYREEHNTVEELRAQGWRVDPRYGTETYWTAEVYRWEKIGSHKEYGSWTRTGSVTVGANTSSLPSGIYDGAWVQTSETSAVRWWVRSSPIYTTYYVYSYTLYRRNWRWFPPGWGSWYYAGSGTETFTSYRGGSFTSGGGWSDDWKKVYSYSSSYARQTGTVYTYGYDTYTRSVRWVDDYGWVYRGRQEFSSPPVNGGGWEYRNVTPYSRQVLVGYEASRTVPVYGWVARSGEEPPLGARVWDGLLVGRVENGRSGIRVVYGSETASQPQVGWITNLQQTYEVRRVPKMVVESYTAYHLYEVPSSWSPASSTVQVSPRNGYSGAVRLSAEGGSLGTGRLHLSPPAFTSLSAGPGVARVRAYALDARGVEREVASSEFRVEAGGLVRYVGDVMKPPEDVSEVGVSSEVSVVKVGPTFLTQSIDIIYHDRWTNPYEGYAAAIVSFRDETGRDVMTRMVYIQTQARGYEFWSEVKKKLATWTAKLEEDLKKLILPSG
jgi:hypothetical protein